MENNTIIFKTTDGGEFKAPLEITNMLIYAANYIKGTSNP